MGTTVAHTDKIASVLLLGLAAAVFVLSADFPAGIGETSPAFFPRVIAALIAVFALYQLGRSVVDGTVRAHEIDWHAAGRVAVVAVLVVVYVVAMPWLGFVLGTALFLLVTMRYSGVERYDHSIPLSIGIAVVLYYVFFAFLRVPLPRSEYVPIEELLPPLPLLLEWITL